MNFELTEERRMLQDGLRRYLGTALDSATRRTAAEGDPGFSPEIWAGLAEMGVIGALFSEADGGFGGAGFDLGVVFEELGRAGATEPLLEVVLAGGLIAARGTDDQKAVLGDVIGGGTQLAFAHGEPASRYDLDRVETRAEARPETRDGGHVLTGRKSVVTNGAQADLVVISARTAGAAGDREGISLFLVPRGTDGVEMRDYPLQGGGRAAEIGLDGVALPQGALLGGAGDAWGDIEAATARATAALCAEALGLMESCRGLTTDYLRQRKQFGQPLGKFQALQHRMADMAVEIEQARSAVINLTGHLDRLRDLRELHVSAAKQLVGRVAKLVVEDSIQLHGGIGMTEEYALAHLARRLTMADHRLGDSAYHLARFVRMRAA